MQRLEVSGAVRLIDRSLGIKGLKMEDKVSELRFIAVNVMNGKIWTAVNM